MTHPRTAARLTAIATSVAAALATTALAAPAQAAERDTSGWKQTGFAFQNNSWAARVTAVDDLRTVRLNSSRIDCTRSVGRLSRNDLAQTLTGDVAASLKDFGVTLSGLSGTNVTYRQNGRTGSRATNLIGDISIAPPLPDGMDGSPGRIVMTNVQTLADAYKDASGFHAVTDISWGDLELELPSAPGLEPLSEPAQELVDLLTGTGNGVVREVVQLLKDTPVPIEIPGLASFDLGWERTVARRGYAMAGAYGLLIKVADNGETNGPRIELGRSFARTDGRARSGVINGTTSGVGRTGLLSEYAHSKVPCVGTGGKTRTRRFRGLTVPGVATVGAATNSYYGKQRRRGGLVAWARSETRFVEVPALDLRLQNLTGRAFVRQQRGRVVERSIGGSAIGSLLVGGERYDLPARGERLELGGGAVLRTLVTRRTKRGLSMASAVIDRPDGPSLRFGVAKVIIKRR